LAPGFFNCFSITGEKVGVGGQDVLRGACSGADKPQDNHQHGQRVKMLKNSYVWSWNIYEAN